MQRRYRLGVVLTFLVALVLVVGGIPAVHASPYSNMAGSWLYPAAQSVTYNNYPGSAYFNPYMFQAGGPCVGQSTCTVDTVAEVQLYGTYLNSYSKGDRYYNLLSSGAWLSGSGSLLTSVARYNNGPCNFLRQRGASCRFTYRDFYYNADNRLKEYTEIYWGGTMYYWIWDAYSAQLLAQGSYNPLKLTTAPGSTRPRP